MRISNSCANRSKICLFDICLFSLIVMNELPRIYVFAQFDKVYNIINILQVIFYFLLLLIIVKKGYNVKQIFIFTIMGSILFIGYLESRMSTYFTGLMLILASKNVEFKKVVHIFRMAISSVFVLSLLLFITGISNSGIGRRDSIALGYVHPNIAAQVILIISLLWLVEIGENLCLKHYIIIEFVSVLIFIITGSRTSTILVAAMPFIIKCTKKTINNNNKFSKVSLLLIKLSQLILFIFTYVTANILEKSSIVQDLDLMFNNRIFLNYYCLRKFGVKLFGQSVVLQDNSGSVYNNIRNVYNVNITVDNSYMISLLIMGIIPSIIFLMGYIFVVKKAIREKDYVIISICLVLAIYSFSESQMVQIYNNFIYFYIMAISSYKLTNSMNDVANNKTILIKDKTIK